VIRLLRPVVFALCLAILAIDAVGAEPARPKPCEFVLGFAAFREALGAPYVGDCEGDQRFDEDGNAHQQTTRGTLSWEAAPNLISFRDGSRVWFAGQGDIGAEVLVTGLHDTVDPQFPDMPVPETVRAQASRMLMYGTLEPGDLGTGWRRGESPLLMPRTAAGVCDLTETPTFLGSVQTWLYQRETQRHVTHTLSALPEWGIGPLEPIARAWAAQCDGQRIDAPDGSFIFRTSIEPFVAMGDESWVQRLEAELPGVDERYVSRVAFVRYGGLVSGVGDDQHSVEGEASEEIEMARLLDLAQRAELRIRRTAYLMSRFAR
jgi:hypothetical protein